MNKKTVRDGLATAIGGVSEVSSRSITPVGVWVPDIGGRGDIDAPLIQVAPVELDRQLISRGSNHGVYTMQAAIVEPLGDDPETTGDTASAMAEAITEAILGSVVGTVKCTGVKETTAANPQMWREKRLFVTVLEFTLKE